MTASDQAICILFVDDEPLIFETVKEALEDGGFTVRPEHTVDGAMHALEECGRQLAGVITDVNLGSKITGWEIAKRARELRPEMPIVYTSGYTAGDWSAQGVPHSTMVPKPYAPAQIVTAISALINKAASQPRLA
jgi:DNA-binding response OmpR family regulator